MQRARVHPWGSGEHPSDGGMAPSTGSGLRVDASNSQENTASALANGILLLTSAMCHHLGAYRICWTGGNGMATTAAVADVTPTDVGFKRELGLIGATWASETSIIGSGWLFGAFYAATSAGPAALIGWVIGGVMIIVLALVHAELGGMFPVAGGTARFPHFAYGGGAGTAFGFFSWLQAVTVAPVECYAVFEYLSYYDHGLFNPTKGLVTGAGFACTIGLMAVFTLINFLAMRLYNRVASAITWWKVLVPVVAIVILLTKFHTGPFTDAGGFFIGGAGWKAGMKAVFAAIPSAGIVFSYLGFEQADQLAAEVRDPKRNLPRAIIYSILLATLIYVLLQVVFIAAMPASALKNGWLGVASNPVISAGPFAALAGLLAFGWFATVLRVDAFISPSGTGSMYLTSTSRVGYGLARNRYYPQIFAKVDKRGVPWVSLLFGFALGLVFLLPFPSWVSLVSVVTGASVLMYAGAPLAMGAFRLQIPDHHRPYQMPGGMILAPIAFIFANLIIYWSGFLTVLKLGVALCIGYALIGICMAFDKQRPKLHLRSAWWVPVWLIGMGIISWQGNFDFNGTSTTFLAPVNTGHIHFWWDLLIVAGWSLAIYIAAIVSRLPREEMLARVAEQSARQPEIEADPNLSR